MIEDRFFRNVGKERDMEKKKKDQNPEIILSFTDLNAALVPSGDWMLRLLPKNSSRIWVSEC